MPEWLIIKLAAFIGEPSKWDSTARSLEVYSLIEHIVIIKEAEEERCKERVESAPSASRSRCREEHQRSGTCGAEGREQRERKRRFDRTACSLERETRDASRESSSNDEAVARGLHAEKIYSSTLRTVPARDLNEVPYGHFDLNRRSLEQLTSQTHVDIAHAGNKLIYSTQTLLLSDSRKCHAYCSQSLFWNQNSVRSSLLCICRRLSDGHPHKYSPRSLSEWQVIGVNTPKSRLAPPAL